MKEYADFFVRNWVLIVVLGNFLLAVSNIGSKIILSGSVAKPLRPTLYTFVTAATGFIFFIPAAVFNFWFHFIVADFSHMLGGILSGLFFVAGLGLFYFVLSRNETSRVMTVIVGAVPLFTLGLGNLFFGQHFGGGQLLAFAFLVAGGILVTAKNRRPGGYPLKDWFFTAAAALSFAAGAVLAEFAFKSGGFLSGLVWISGGYAASSVSILLLPGRRKEILISGKNIERRNSVMFALEKILGTAGSFLTRFAISLAGAALVTAFEGLRQFFILIFAWFFSFKYPQALEEELSGVILWKKILAAILVGIGLFLLAFSPSSAVNPTRSIVWGVTFSEKFSRELGLDWKNNFTAVLNELRPKKIRLIAYWDEIEKTKGSFDFSGLDWQIDEAGRAGAKVILVLGMKVPRWPECHIPDWAKPLQTEERERFLRFYVGEAVKRYLDSPAVETWQAENEPFLMFGECPRRGKDFLKKEVELIKSLDKTRAVLVTDSGELGLWYKAVKSGDVFGTTMYRKIYPQFIGRFTGVFEYPLPPGFFRFKEKLARFITGEQDKRFIVVELQSEPWGAVPIPELSFEEQLRIFSPDYFSETVDYAKAAGFDEYYFWGTEWWYYLKINDFPAFWNAAKTIF